MSFATEVKDDLLKKVNSTKTMDLLELEAMLRFSSEIVISFPMRLNFTCPSMSIIRHFITLCKKYFTIEYQIESRVIQRFDNHTVFTCQISTGAADLIKEFNLIGSESTYKSNIEVEEMTSYLRGAFLVRGSVSDPNSRTSHLEISTPNQNEILFIQKLMNTFELNARISKRKNYYICYIKSKDSIGDFLYQVGATSSMTYYEDIVITKEIKATAKREVNLDLANQEKTNKASQEMLKYIEYLEYNYPLETLDNKLLMIMKVRKENPEHSLTQLLDIIHEEYDPNLSKSGLNHRLRKLKEMAINLIDEKNKV